VGKTAFRECGGCISGGAGARVLILLKTELTAKTAKRDIA